MKKLIAQRPIQYLGRAYERGAALPANDSLMTAAWLKAGSAAWEEPVREAVAPAIQETDNPSRVNDLAADVLRALGVELTDEDGHFVGEERLKEQLRALAPDLSGTHEDVVPPPAEAPADGVPPEEGSGILEPMPNGHFSRADLLHLTKAELLDLAEDLDVDLSGCRTNAERAEALASVDAKSILEAAQPGPPPEAPA